MVLFSHLKSIKPFSWDFLSLLSPFFPLPLTSYFLSHLHFISHLLPNLLQLGFYSQFTVLELYSQQTAKTNGLVLTSVTFGSYDHCPLEIFSLILYPDLSPCSQILFWLFSYFLHMLSMDNVIYWHDYNYSQSLMTTKSGSLASTEFFLCLWCLHLDVFVGTSDRVCSKLNMLLLTPHI